MLVRGDGAFFGSVSGGCVENDVLFTAMEHARRGGSTLLSFGVEDEASWKQGLPCGGTIEILVQSVDDLFFPRRVFAELSLARSQRALFVTSTDIAAGRTVMGIRSGTFVNFYEPQRRMLIVGAVQIAQSLSRFARDLDFDVTVIDPRAAYLTPERFPDVGRDDRWPDEAVRAARPDISTAVVTLSHDRKLDDPALVAALAHPTGYVAALGSRRSHDARVARLRGCGLHERAIAFIEGPAGVPIGGRGVAEIALSIAAGAVRQLSGSPDVVSVDSDEKILCAEAIPRRTPERQRAHDLMEIVQNEF